MYRVSITFSFLKVKQCSTNVGVKHVTKHQILSRPTCSWVSRPFSIKFLENFENRCRTPERERRGGVRTEKMLGTLRLSQPTKAVNALCAVGWVKPFAEYPTCPGLLRQALPSSQYSVNGPAYSSQQKDLPPRRGSLHDANDHPQFLHLGNGLPLWMWALRNG